MREVLVQSITFPLSSSHTVTHKNVYTVYIFTISATVIDRYGTMQYYANASGSYVISVDAQPNDASKHGL